MKKALALLLSLVMVFQMLPVSAFAADGVTSTDAEAGINFSNDPSYLVTWTIGEVKESSLVVEGTLLSSVLPDSKTMEDGDRFTGWIDSNDNSVDPSTTEVRSPISVTAVFEPVAGVATMQRRGAPARNAEGSGEVEQQEPEQQEQLEPEYWTVTFYDRDAQVYATVQVEKGHAIGELPAVIEREDYNAYWAIGEIVQGGQGAEIKVTGALIDDTFVPAADMVIVPDYKKIVFTVSFYDTNEDDRKLIATETVDVDTNYCLNNMPTVPVKNGSIGKWVYSDGNSTRNFTNSVAIKENTTVWAEYELVVFNVTFEVDGKTYQSDKYNINDALVLPNDPVVEGKEFQNWIDEEGDKVTAGTQVTRDMTITATFKDNYYVNFVVKNDDGTEGERLSQYFRNSGEAIGTMPQDPFVAGKVFEKWVIQGTETEVNADTVVSSNMTVEAVFRSVEVYMVIADYYYIDGNNAEFVFNTDVIEVEGKNLPYTITAPVSTKTDPNLVPGGPIYFPEQPTLEVKESDFDSEKKCTVRFKYVPYTAVYDFVYQLKNLTGDGYTEIEREEGVQGVLNSYVTPTIRTYPYAELELAEGATITQASGQKLYVNYTRKNFQVTYDTRGGSYVPGTTVPYGTEYAVTSTVPTRTGYTFAGWYKDEDLTKEAEQKITIEGNTTLYAMWNGENVHYTIVYMFEKYNDAGTESSYVYDNSRDATGTVGSTVQASSAPSIDRNGWVADIAKNNNSSVVIAADGSSVLLVYYKLKEYTFKFHAYYYNNYYYVYATLPDQNVSEEIEELSYTMTVKLGQDISSTWPINVKGKYYDRYYQRHDLGFDGWVAPGTARYVTKRTIVTTDMIPSEGETITYYAQWTTQAKTYTVNYWLQNADDDGYTKSQTYSQTYTSSSGNLGCKGDKWIYL